MTDTLDTLPPGVKLTELPQQFPTDRSPQEIQARPTVACSNDLNDTTGPVKAQVVYYISGIPAGKESDYYRSVIKAWQDKKWNVTEPQRSVEADAVTTDGYFLSVRHGGDQGFADDTVGLAGVSTCFPKSATGTTSPLPTEITHN
ncbi:hypothetical protein IU500_19430 [Nocardia terpenica]|nr:hypothetical protein [Nocardia terpenica]MBF6106211.1 hypothetical protein [Nocardia terpenica]